MICSLPPTVRKGKGFEQHSTQPHGQRSISIGREPQPAQCLHVQYVLHVKLGKQRNYDDDDDNDVFSFIHALMVSTIKDTESSACL